MSDLNLDELAGKIAKLLNIKKSPDDGDDFEDARGRVPVARLQREIAARKAAEQQVLDIGAAFDAFKTGTQSTLDAFKADQGEQLKTIQGQHRVDLDLAGSLDADGRTALRNHWSTLPKEGRGKNPAEFWTGIQAQHKAHGEDAKENAAPDLPRTLSGYLPELKAPEPPPKRGRDFPKLGDTRPNGAGAPVMDDGMDSFLDSLPS